MDRSDAMWPEELCTICYIIPKIHWFLCVYMKFEKVNISNNSVWKYHGRLTLLHTSVCCWVFFLFLFFLTGDFFVGCIFVLIFGVDCIVLIFCALHCIVFCCFFLFLLLLLFFFWGGVSLSVFMLQLCTCD